MRLMAFMRHGRPFGFREIQRWNRMLLRVRWGEAKNLTQVALMARSGAVLASAQTSAPANRLVALRDSAGFQVYDSKEPNSPILSCSGMDFDGAFLVVNGIPRSDSRYTKSVIIDDPPARGDDASAEMRQKAANWLEGVLMTCVVCGKAGGKHIPGCIAGVPSR